MPANVDSEAHRRHDYFNLMAIPVIVGANAGYFGSLFYGAFYAGENVEQINALTDDLFTVMFWAFNAYMLIDIIWLLVSPTCVASPALIILHHIVAVAGWLTSAFDPNIQPWTSAAVSVELNTFFLIARRNFPSNLALDFGFVVTWVALRLGVYPYMVYGYYRKFSEHIHPQHGLNVYSISYICLLLLMALNLKWSVDLVSNRKSFFSKGARLKKGL